ncbi:glycerol-3-phosphate dehydrogenase/oxidase [Propioniciclava soli]|uniref:Glycerol-3-phosphate dehydrogenase n=1 Tax=Propioniciclava soli TaxID=2775081 RepID=A0ABZ3CA95_9ACTN|nr:glycerol-3-phosphate dehydrogenase/oxidase [Propioniciclava soli]
MTIPTLNPDQRERDLEALASETLDILVIGGGVTGAGSALDAATRGLKVGIVEAQDWASGTSSRSSRLIHGGLRYLYNLDFALVAEALAERGRLLTTLAPHLVKAQPFLWPLKQRVIERAYSAVGVGLYDVLAVAGAGGRKTVPVQKHLSKAGAKEHFADVRDDALIGAIEFYDARVDDARFVVNLVRSAVRHGARAVSRTQVVGLLQDASGRVTGARVVDLESGREFEIAARAVINATGVWTETTQAYAKTDKGLKVLASKGIHIVVPRERIKARSGMFLRTEKSVLFIIPWRRYWVIGTTDTAWHEQLKHPVPTSADIDYVLDHANAVLSANLTREDIIGTYAGLRPLLQPVGSDEAKSAKVSREHTTLEAAPGLVVIAGGKYTTYRVMAADAVDLALGARAKQLPSITKEVPLLGADGYRAFARRADAIAEQYGWDADLVADLLDRYGSELPALLALVDEDPSLGRPLGASPWYLRADVAFACRYEGALHLEDILIQRIRLNSTTPDRGASAVDEVAEVAAPILGWDDERVETEKSNYRERAAAEVAAQSESTDAEASARRVEAEDVVPSAL